MPSVGFLPSVHRRDMLTSTGIALAAALSGCTTDADPSGDGTPTGTDDQTPSPTATGVAVSDIVARKAVTYESTMGSGGVLAARDRQYVVASATADRELLASDFALETGDRTFEPGLPDTRGGFNAAVAGHEGHPVGRAPRGEPATLAFDLPSPLSIEDARITYDGEADASWSLPAAAVERLAAPTPRFELVDLAVPERVSPPDPLPVSLTVRNASNVDGRFLAAVYWPTKLIADDDESTVVDETVGAGEEVTVSLELDTEYTTSEEEQVTLSVRGYVRADRDVTVEGGSTPG